MLRSVAKVFWLPPPAGEFARMTQSLPNGYARFCPETGGNVSSGRGLLHMECQDVHVVFKRQIVMETRFQAYFHTSSE